MRATGSIFTSGLSVGSGSFTGDGCFELGVCAADGWDGVSGGRLISSSSSSSSCSTAALLLLLWVMSLVVCPATALDVGTDEEEVVVTVEVGCVL